MATVLRLFEDGPKEVKFSLKDGTIKLNIEEMVTGGVWVAVHNQKTLDKIMEVYRMEVK